MNSNVLKFIELVQTNNTSMLIKMTIYCIKAFALRQFVNVYVLDNNAL